MKRNVEAAWRPLSERAPAREIHFRIGNAAPFKGVNIEEGGGGTKTTHSRARDYSHYYLTGNCQGEAAVLMFRVNKS